MGYVFVQERFEASAGLIWKLISDFGELNRFHLAVMDCKLSGTERTLLFLDGSTVVEDLRELDSDNYKLVYGILDSPFPFSEYVSTIELKAVGDEKTDFIWSATFVNDDPSEESEIVSLLEDFYLAGMNGIRELVE